MKNIFIAVILLFSAFHACDAFSPGYEGYFSKDSDNWFVQQHTIALNTGLSGHSWIGSLFSYSGYSGPSRSESTKSYQLRYRYKSNKRWDLSAQGGLLQYLKNTMPVYDGNAVYVAPGGFRLEINANRSIVDTFAVFDNGISVATLFASADIPMGSKFLAVAGADKREFSDGNERSGLITKAILFLPADGLSLQVWHRQFRDTKSDSIGYFNPDAINFQRLILSYRRGLAKGLRVSIKTGPGSQQVDNDDRTSTYYFEGGLLKKTTEGLSLAVNYIYTDSIIDNNLLSYGINIVNCNITHTF